MVCACACVCVCVCACVSCTHRCSTGQKLIRVTGLQDKKNVEMMTQEVGGDQTAKHDGRRSVQSSRGVRLNTSIENVRQ